MRNFLLSDFYCYKIENYCFINDELAAWVGAEAPIVQALVVVAKPLL